MDMITGKSRINDRGSQYRAMGMVRTRLYESSQHVGKKYRRKGKYLIENIKGKAARQMV